jgi:hypothetical protein
MRSTSLGCGVLLPQSASARGEVIRSARDRVRDQGDGRRPGDRDGLEEPGEPLAFSERDGVREIGLGLRPERAGFREVRR